MRHIAASAIVLGLLVVSACGDEQGIRAHSPGTGGSANTGGTSFETGGSTTTTSTGGSETSSGGSGAGSAGAATASGGTFSASGATGSGGGLSIGGSASGGTGSDPILRTRAELVAFEGHVYRVTNDFGIEGDWKPLASAANTVTSDLSGTKVCAQGTVKKTGTGDIDWGAYWGAVLALVLNNNGPGTAGVPYNALDNGFAGIEASISGPKIPATLLMKLKAYAKNEDYCIKLTNATSGSRHRLLTKDALMNCNATPGAAVDAGILENFEFHVVADSAVDIEFDFCVSDVKVIPLDTSAAGSAGG